MAKIPHPCYDPDEFRLNTDTSQIEMHLDPAGYMASGPNGVRVNLPTLPPAQPAAHSGWWAHNFVLTGPINTGILDIGGNGPVTTVLSAPAISNTSTRPLELVATASINAVILGPAGAHASAAEVTALVSWDGGVDWHQVTTVGMFTPNSDSRAAYFTQSDRVRHILNPGQTVTPRWIAQYVAVFNHVDYVQASFLKTVIQGHTL